LSLRRRLFLTLCLFVVVGFLSIAKWIQGELRDSYSQVIEELMVDYAHLLSAHLENGKMSAESFQALGKMFEQYRGHSVQAQIFNFVKQDFTLDLYVTDAAGKVLFSTKPFEVGQDYSKWNDVYKTLQGQYGARSTRTQVEDSRSSIYYVAAPIVLDQKISGVVTLSKTEMSVLIFLDRALQKMFLGGLFSVIALGLLGGLILIWMTLPLEKLRTSALRISEGHRESLPISNIREVRELSAAFEKMRVSLEGKKTVERYTQSLTHELKSPLTAIKGAAELCMEEMDQEHRQSFLKNIVTEANRSHHMLEQLLKIAALESKSELEQITSENLHSLFEETISALMPLWKAKSIEIELNVPDHFQIQCDRFVLVQALRNLIQNAIEFSPQSSTIEVAATQISIPAKDGRAKTSRARIDILDQGAGIPDFAIERVFEKFYSLERPDTRRKSSGLGLAFAKEVIELHHGKISIESPASNQQGTRVCVELPFPDGEKEFSKSP
jgi:two-component system sensor histidine kinase CreC